MEGGRKDQRRKRKVSDRGGYSREIECRKERKPKIHPGEKESINKGGNNPEWIKRFAPYNAQLTWRGFKLETFESFKMIKKG